MKRRAKNSMVFVFAAFVAFGILCSTFAGPGQAVASVTGCSQMPGRMAMAGCENPNYLCGISPASNLLARGALSSAPSNDSLKNALGLAFVTGLIDVSADLAPPGKREWRNATVAEPGKVSVHLFNSVLNL